jgi:hypothetical protein
VAALEGGVVGSEPHCSTAKMEDHTESRKRVPPQIADLPVIQSAKWAQEMKVFHGNRVYSALQGEDEVSLKIKGVTGDCAGGC